MAENKKILIVEDDEDIQMIEETYLQAAGFQTEIIADGEQVEDRYSNSDGNSEDRIDRQNPRTWTRSR